MQTDLFFCIAETDSFTETYVIESKVGYNENAYI